MIVNQDIKPERQAYFIGSQILAELVKEESNIVEVGPLFITLQGKMDLSYHAFSMAMNWLFLMGALNHLEGKIVRCF